MRVITGKLSKSVSILSPLLNLHYYGNNQKKKAGERNRKIKRNRGRGRMGLVGGGGGGRGKKRGQILAKFFGGFFGARGY